MKKFKRIIALLTVALFIFSFAAPTFANTAATTSTQTGTSDVAGTKFLNAVSRLGALNVLAGYPDGTFKPGNNITRAEMAAVAVNAIGLKDAAAYAKGKTKFKDVAGDNWAAGFINVASSQGIIAGYPNGTYKPDANVTYAEVSTILVRLLGYGPDVKGSWPVNYISKATELGLLKNTEFEGNKPATRGDVALMTDKATVDTAPLEFDGYDNTGKANYRVNRTLTIAKKYLGVAEGDVTITAVDYTEQSVTGWVLVDDKKPVADKDGKTANAPIKLLNSGIADLKSLSGKKVKIGAQEINLGDGKAWRIIYITPLTGSENVVVGKIKDDDLNASKAGGSRVVNAVYLGSDKTVSEFDVKLAGSDTIKTYKLDTGANLTVERNRFSLSAVNTFGDGDEVELILNDAGRVRFVKAYRYDSAAIVKSFEAKGTAGRTYDTLNVFLPGETGSTALNTNDNFISDVLITKDGKPAKLADFKAGDYVDFAWKDNADYTGRDITIVNGYTAKTVTGKATKFHTDKDGDRYVTLENSVYGGYELPGRLNGSGFATVVKLDNNEGAYNSTNHDSKLLGSNITISLDSAGKARYINASTSDSTIAGYVKKIASGQKSGQFGSDFVTGRELTVVDKNGKENKVIIDNATAHVEQNNGHDITDDTDIAKGDIVSLKMSSGYAKGAKSTAYKAGNAAPLNNLIAGITLQKSDSEADAPGEGFVNSNGTVKVVTAGPSTTTYIKGSDTVVFDATGASVKVVEWSALKDGQTVNFGLNTNGITVDYVVIKQQKRIWGYGVDKYTYSDEDNTSKNAYKVLTKDGIVEYEVSGADAAAFATYAIVAVDATNIDNGDDLLNPLAGQGLTVDKTYGDGSIKADSIQGSQKVFQNTNNEYVLVTDSTFLVNAITADKPVAAEFGNLNSNSKVKVFATTGAGSSTDPFVANLIVITK